MKPVVLLAAMLLVLPLGYALQEELIVNGCSAIGCSVAELNDHNNVSGTTISKNVQESANMTAFSAGPDSTITGVSARLSHSGQAGISGTWTVDFRSQSTGTVWCSVSTPLSQAWVAETLTPTGCGWTLARLQDLEIAFMNNDGQSPHDGFIDFVNVTVNFTRPPVRNGFERYLFVNHTIADIAWRTNLPANSSVSYGTTTALGTTETDATEEENHSLRISGLTRNTLYYYNITSCDAFSCDTTGPFTFETFWTLNATSCTATSCDIQEVQEYDNQTGATYDGATPYAVNVSALPEPNATIRTLRYRTHHNASADIVFRNRTSKQEWCRQTVATTGMTYHEVTPSGCDWTHERVDALEILHNTTAGTAIIDFSAVIVEYIIAPQIHDVQHSDVTTESATISWQTRNAANSTLRWGPTTALANTEVNTTPGYIRSFALTGLADNTTFHYNVTSCTAESCETQGPFSFRTDELITPSIVNLTIANRSTTNVTLTWDTNKPANATIRWGETEALADAQSRSALQTSHSFTITGLFPGRLYHFQAENCDALGCDTQTGTFVTAPSAEHCTYRYVQQADDWEEGILKDGDVIVVECRSPGPVEESEDLRLSALLDGIRLDTLLTTPRLLTPPREVLFP